MAQPGKQEESVLTKVFSNSVKLVLLANVNGYGGWLLDSNFYGKW